MAKEDVTKEVVAEGTPAQATAMVETMAGAIVEGIKSANQKNFELNADEGIKHRFSVVKDKKTGEVLLRDNETQKLSALQLESLEEKEANLQDREVEEV